MTPQVSLLGHMWVPDLDRPSSGEMHLEYMLKTVGDEQFAGAVLVQRRYRDFERLAAALAPVARRAHTPLPPLPSALTFGRQLSTEFAVQRQAALQTWLTRVVARPPLWCDPLRTFLGLDETPPAQHDAPHDVAAGGAITLVGGGGGGSSGGNGGGGGSAGALDAAAAAELRWIARRALQPGCGVAMDGGAFRASTLVKWLGTQALVTSREQGVPLAEAMRRQGLLEAVKPTNGPAHFVDGAVLYRFNEAALASG